MFTVIIPTYNRAHVLERAIESVFAQSFDEYELIVVDDGSSDETESVCLKYPKIRYIKQKNSGVSTARNLAVREARYPWIAFLDSDDEWLPSKLEKQADFINKNSLRLVHGEEIWIRNGVRVNPRKKHQKSGGDIFTRSLELCLISPSCVVLEKNLFEEMGGFREDFEVCEDYDLWLKITSRYEVGFITDPLIKKYGGHEDQLSHKYKAMDYWRVVSMMDLLDLNKLSEKQAKSLKNIVLSKSSILSAGYKKHGHDLKEEDLKKLISSL